MEDLGDLEDFDEENIMLSDEEEPEGDEED